ncbi:hypothetical protein UlMin_032268 [Ulmus minor]
MAVMMMSTDSSSRKKATALTEEDRRERSVTKEEAKKGESSMMVSSYWGISCKHHVPKMFIDKFAYRMVKLLRIPTDLFFKRQYGCRPMMLETVAAILGIVGGILLHLRSLRKVVGYMEEEAIHSYTKYLKDLNDCKIKNVLAPAIAIDYWKLPKDATLKDVITVICADESHHRDVNHFVSDIHYQGKELREAPAPPGYH